LSSPILLPPYFFNLNWQCLVYVILQVKIEELVAEMGGVLHTKTSLDLNFVIVKNVLAAKYKVWYKFLAHISSLFLIIIHIQTHVIRI